MTAGSHASPDRASAVGSTDLGASTEHPELAADAIVIGAGPNGLVAANLLADRGWSVIVLEAADRPGGAVRTEELTAPGFANDVFSAFYPMTAASHVMRSLELERHGLAWTHAPSVLAHPRSTGPAAVLHRRVDDTADVLERACAGDGDRYRSMYATWQSVSEPFVRSLLSPFPPVRAGVRLLARTRIRATRDLARLALVPLHRFVDEQFRGEPGKLLVAGNALHADLTPDTAGSALFGWLLVGLGQEHGFPVPVGGAGRITDALVRRAVSGGVVIRCGHRVERVVVEGGRATGVVDATGTRWTARRAVLADCDAVKLMLHMVGERHLPPVVVQRMHNVQRASATVKVDWALRAPVPWSDPSVVGAGTVHIAENLDELTMTSAQLATGAVPDRPFLLVGQMTTSDPTRSPAGTESMWAYTHVPQDIRSDAGGEGIDGSWDERSRDLFVERIERRIEAMAPGFRDLVIGRHVMTPPDLERRNPNLVGGDISGGTAQLHQQLVLRPIPGLGRAETPIAGLYLASASAHPGGAVHGACGANAARAALWHDRTGRARAALGRAGRRALRP